MKNFKDFDGFAVGNDHLFQIVGGTETPVHNEDVPVTTLGTVTHDDDI